MKEDEARRKRMEAGVAQFEKAATDPGSSSAMREGNAREAALVKARLSDLRSTYIVTPTETFVGELVIDDAERPLSVRYIGRGNTAGDAVAWLPRQRILATGDAVIAPGPFAFNVTPASWVETLQRIKQFAFATLVPGHGAPQKDASYLDKMIAAIEEVRTAVGPLARSGMSLEEVTKTARFDRQVQSFTGGDPYGEDVLRSYWIEPLISSAYREAKGEPVIEGS